MGRVYLMNLEGEAMGKHQERRPGWRTPNWAEERPASEGGPYKEKRKNTGLKTGHYRSGKTPF
jgi:hypothetical protein